MARKLENDDRVRLIDIKDLPDEWQLKTGKLGNVSHFHAPEGNPAAIVAYVKFRGHKVSCRDTDLFPLHISRLEPV